MGLRERIARRLLGSDEVPRPYTDPGVVELKQRLDTLMTRAGHPPTEVPSSWEQRFDSFVNAISGLGGPNDKGSAGFVNLDRVPLNFGQLTALYRWNAYAGRIIDLVPDEGTRKGWIPAAVDEEVDNKAVEKADADLCLVELVNEAWKWAGKDGGCVIMMVVDEDPPPGFSGPPSPRWLEQPLDPARVNKLKALVVLDRPEATPEDFEGRLAGANGVKFREPKLWNITPSSPAGLPVGGKVHASRLLRFRGRRLQPTLRNRSNGYDDSILDRAHDAIRFRTEVDQAMATLSQEAQIPVIKIEGLSAVGTGDEEDYFQRRMKEFAYGKAINRAAVIGEGESFDIKAASFAGLKDIKDAANEALSVASGGIPIPRLLGQASQGLNNTGEAAIDSFNKDVSAAQVTNLTTPLTQYYDVLFASNEGPTDGVVPESWKLVFLPLEEPTEQQAALLKKTYAEIDEINMRGKVYTPERVARSRYAGEFSTELLEESASEEQLAEVRAIAAGSPTDADTDTDTDADTDTDTDTDTDRADQAEAGAVKAYLSVPLSPGALKQWTAARERVEELLGPLEEPGGPAPHVTVLFMGPVAVMNLPVVVAGLGEVAGDTMAFTYRTHKVSSFEPTENSDGRTPILMKLDEWRFTELHEALWRRLGHVASAAQFKHYEAHITLGLLPRELTADERAALMEIITGIEGAAATVDLAFGGQTVGSYPMSTVRTDEES